MENNNNLYYKHYLSIDWSQQDVSIARMRAGSNQPETKLFPSDIKKIKEYLKGLQGKKILTIEETTGSHWLYVELLESPVFRTKIRTSRKGLNIYRIRYFCYKSD